MSVREASRRLGISRNTATKWLKDGQMVEPRYPQRVSAPSILDPYKEQLSQWLKADSHRSKRDRRGIKAMFEALRAQGYSGSRGPVYAFAQRWQQEQGNAARGAGFVPLSFELGEAFQFDWSCEYLFIGGLRRRLEVAHTKLAASRGTRKFANKCDHCVEHAEQACVSACPTEALMELPPEMIFSVASPRAHGDGRALDTEPFILGFDAGVALDRYLRVDEANSRLPDEVARATIPGQPAPRCLTPARGLCYSACPLRSGSEYVIMSSPLQDRGIAWPNLLSS